MLLRTPLGYRLLPRSSERPLRAARLSLSGVEFGDRLCLGAGAAARRRIPATFLMARAIQDPA